MPPRRRTVFLRVGRLRRTFASVVCVGHLHRSASIACVARLHRSLPRSRPVAQGARIGRLAAPVGRSGRTGAPVGRSSRSLRSHRGSSRSLQSVAPVAQGLASVSRSLRSLRSVGRSGRSVAVAPVTPVTPVALGCTRITAHRSHSDHRASIALGLVQRHRTRSCSKASRSVLFKGIARRSRVSRLHRAAHLSLSVGPSVAIGRTRVALGTSRVGRTRIIARRPTRSAHSVGPLGRASVGCIGRTRSARSVGSSRIDRTRPITLGPIGRYRSHRSLSVDIGRYQSISVVPSVVLFVTIGCIGPTISRSHWSAHRSLALVSPSVARIGRPIGQPISVARIGQPIGQPIGRTHRSTHRSAHRSLSVGPSDGIGQPIS